MYTCTISTQEEWQQPGTGPGAWLRGAEEGLDLAYKKKMSGKTDIHKIKEKILAHRASSKTTRLFFRSNKSNINQ